ncbi:MAG: hypothetical protein VW891_11170, partial [Novosphingobium sp.]
WGARPFPTDSREGKFVPLASGIAGDSDVLTINANARVLGATVKAGETVRYDLTEDRHAYLVPAKGRIRIGDIEANARDGVAITGVTEIVITALEDAELVLVDAA